jgi:hypothetical protein
MCLLRATLQLQLKGEDGFYSSLPDRCETESFSAKEKRRGYAVWKLWGLLCKMDGIWFYGACLGFKKCKCCCIKEARISTTCKL